jgi:hypothetical protein
MILKERSREVHKNMFLASHFLGHLVFDIPKGNKKLKTNPPK